MLLGGGVARRRRLVRRSGEKKQRRCGEQDTMCCGGVLGDVGWRKETRQQRQWLLGMAGMEAGNGPGGCGARVLGKR